ncbi:MAG: DHH family phosphoesterase [Cetobacterium sp.]
MIKLITHNDLDGIGCYVVAKYFIDEEIDVSYCSYKNVNEVALETIENIDKYSKVLITDISVNQGIAHKLNWYKGKVQLLDHHPTAEFLNEYSWAKVDLGTNEYKTSGTKMLFDYLVEDYANSSIVEFVELVRRYDTWYWKEINDIKAKQLNDLMYIVGKDEFAEDMIYKTKMNMKLLSDLDFKILDLRQNEIDRYIEKKNKNIIVKDILGYKAGVVFADNFISELGNKLSEMHPELDFIAMVNQETISYRTIKDDVNLSEVAATFGGGGHPKASGSQVEESKTSRFIDDLFNI